MKEPVFCIPTQPNGSISSTTSGPEVRRDSLQLAEVSPSVTPTSKSPPTGTVQAVFCVNSVDLRLPEKTEESTLPNLNIPNLTSGHTVLRIPSWGEDSDDILNVKEVLDDSPMFRMKLSVAEKDVIEFGGVMQRFLKILTDVCSEMVAISKERQKLAAALPQLKYLVNHSNSPEEEHLGILQVYNQLIL